MYKKIRLRLSALFTFVAGLILVIMSVCYLYSSEKELKTASELSFSGDMNTIIAGLEQQNSITQEWLSKIAGSGKYLIAIYDHGVPLHYTRRFLDEETQMLLEEIRNSDTAAQLASRASLSDYTSPHEEFTWQTALDSYNVCVARITPYTKDIDVVILSSTRALVNQLHAQRIRLLLIDTLGIALLFFFSFFYTNLLLSPIREAQNQQTAFIASASHELRTPLAVILSSVTAMEQGTPEEKEHFQSIIQSEGSRMSGLISDMLTLAGADQGALSLHMEKAELDTLLLDTYELFLPLAREKGLSLNISLPEESIPCCRCDTQRITQVLSILISNALSYTPAGGTVVLSLSRRHAFYLSVTDNGMGIPDSDKPHIFDRFYRADSAHADREHFGLGLCIAKEIVQLHHGSLEVRDAAGGGTVFTVVLPPDSSASSHHL